jgi:hypothetical protein
LAQGQQIVGLNLLTRRSLGCFKENVQEDAFANQTSMGDYAIFPFNILQPMPHAGSLRLPNRT